MRFEPVPHLHEADPAAAIDPRRQCNAGTNAACQYEGGSLARDIGAAAAGAAASRRAENFFHR